MAAVAAYSSGFLSFNAKAASFNTSTLSDINTRLAPVPSETFLASAVNLAASPEVSWTTNISARRFKPTRSYWQALKRSIFPPTEPSSSSVLTTAANPAEARSILQAQDFVVEYVEERWGRRLAAAYLEGVRLIDNAGEAEYVTRS